jgi:acetoin utilization deacetylase AcuC-like enzyme
MLHIVHHPDYVVAAPAGSRFRFNKYGLLREYVADEAKPVLTHVPVAMGIEWIKAVHEDAYVDQVLAASLPKAIERRIGFRVDSAVARRSLLATGGTWLAATLALQHGFAANGAGGSHHAMPDTGAGYCVFNDLAIAANRLVAESKSERVLILDCDVHQGDGTAVMLAGRPQFFTLSIHAEKNFPVRKARSSLDVGLPDATDDAAYLLALEQVLPEVMDNFRPSIILYQAGVDCHGEDRLGRLGLSDAGLEARDRYIMRLATRRNTPLASVVGGGYGEDHRRVANRHGRTIVTLADGFANCS